MYVQGFKAPDDKWFKMKQVWDSCRQAGIDPPEEVQRYFEWEKPDPTGVLVELQQTECCQEWSDHDVCEGYQIDISKLPAGVTHIRFVCSY